MSEIPTVAKSIVENLERIYAIGIGLAIREAVRAFAVNQDAKTSDSRHKINWGAVLECIAFGFVAVCFFHGMNRYFETVHLKPGALGDLPGQRRIMLDFVVFLLESSILFVAALKLVEPDLGFYKALFWLFSVDLIWSAFSSLHYGDQVASRFMYLNLGGLLVFGLLFLLYRHLSGRGIVFRIVLCIVTVVRIVIDYRWNWNDFYFG